MSTTTSKKLVKVMVFGTFDGLHLGHLNFFKQARALSRNPFLIVSIARDKNVKKIKGKPPFMNEKDRLSAVKKTKLADKVVLSGVSEYVPHIIKEKPDIIGLGYDQIAYVNGLKDALLGKKLKVKIVRLKPYKENIYKSSLLNVSKSEGHKKSK